MILAFYPPPKIIIKEIHRRSDTVQFLSRGQTIERGEKRQMEKELYFGRKLTETGGRKWLIFLRSGLRASPMAALLLANLIRGIGKPVSVLAGILGVLPILTYFIWALWPLSHCRDYMTCYEGGMDICGVKRTLEELGDISFLDNRSGASLFIETYMCTSVGRFNITYIRDGKKCFNQAYYNTIPL